MVNNLSAFNSGWRLLALMLCSPLGSLISGYLVQKIKFPPVYVFFVATILQTIGLALMGTLDVSDPDVPSAQYAYQVILGLGIGLTLSSLLIAAPTVIREKDTGPSYASSIFPIIQPFSSLFSSPNALKFSSYQLTENSSSRLHRRPDTGPHPRRKHTPMSLHQRAK